MANVVIRIKFTRESLGAVPFNSGFVMLRDAAGRTMFLDSWWRQALLSVSVISKVPVELIESIRWDPVVDGVTGTYRRCLKGSKRHYAVHEAFNVGDVVTVVAAIPESLLGAPLWCLLANAGRCHGISPFRLKPGFGTFQVIAVLPYNGSINSRPLE